MVKTVNVVLSMTPRTRDEIKQMANEREKSVSALLRDLFFQEKKREESQKM